MLEVILRLVAAISVAATGLATAADHASPAANEHAAQAIEATIERIADAAQQANGLAGAVGVDAPPVDVPPVDTPVATGPPSVMPPVAVPPVPAPPVDAPGLEHRP